MSVLIIIILFSLFFYWNNSFIFYKEKTKQLVPNEAKCFSEHCKSITYLNGCKRAVLFIHGFPTTPYMYSYPAAFFRDNGFDVYAPLIPTFGADYREFEKTNFSSWFLFIDSYYANLKKKYDEVYVIGVSMGGAMCLKLAEKYSGTNLSMKKIAVLSAPVTYNSLIKDKIVTNPLAYELRFLSLFIKRINASNIDGIKDGEDGNENWVGYGGTYLRPALSLIYNLKAIRKDLYKITVPMISIHDEGDKTVPFKNQKIITDCVKSKELIILSDKMPEFKHSHHSLLMYNSTKEKYSKIILDFFTGGENEF